MRPGPLAPHERPRKKYTARSYSRSTLRPPKRYSARTPRTAVTTTSISSPSLGGERFDDHRRALAAADAGRAEPEPLLVAAQGVEEVDRDARAGGGERMADRDGAAVDVGLLAVETQLLFDGEVLRGERLVHLDQVHLLELHPRLLQRLPRRGRGTDPHVLGLDAGYRPRHEPAEALYAMGLG